MVTLETMKTGNVGIREKNNLLSLIIYIDKIRTNDGEASSQAIECGLLMHCVSKF